ncbi:MAG: hypothetical protein WBQ54_22675, partial [Pseudolabrys sp.]
MRSIEISLPFDGLVRMLASFSVRTRFRDNMIERERLAQTQAEASRARERRSDIIASTISQFKNSVES